MIEPDISDGKIKAALELGGDKSKIRDMDLKARAKVMEKYA